MEKIGLVAFPLHHVTSQIAVNLNGTRLQSEPRDTILPRMRFWPQCKLDKIPYNFPVKKVYQNVYIDTPTI